MWKRCAMIFISQRHVRRYSVVKEHCKDGGEVKVRESRTAVRLYTGSWCFNRLRTTHNQTHYFAITTLLSFYPWRECARPVRKWGCDHKRFLAVSCCAAVSKKFLYNFYFWSKHHARRVRCFIFRHRFHRFHCLGLT